MARRRSYDDGREAVSIFSLSFLDVFACALGALVLILLIIFNQVTLTFDNDTLRARIEAVETKKETVIDEVRANTEAEKAAREWDATKAAVQSRLEQLEKEVQDKQAAAAPFQGLTTDTLEQARQAVEQVQSQTVRQRESVNNMWFGTASVQQKMRLVEVYADRFVDHGKEPAQSFDETRISDLVDRLKRVRALEYPLFVIHPDGIDLWRQLEPQVEQNGLLYGFEPYTGAWDAILGRGKS